MSKHAGPALVGRAHEPLLTNGDRLAMHQPKQLVDGQVHQTIPICCTPRLPALPALQRGGFARACTWQYNSSMHSSPAVVALVQLLTSSLQQCVPAGPCCSASWHVATEAHLRRSSSITIAAGLPEQQLLAPHLNHLKHGHSCQIHGSSPHLCCPQA